MNTPVSSTLAKLLKNKECLEYSRDAYNNKGDIVDSPTYDDEHYLELVNFYYAPTIAEVVMWLYEKHGIWIAVTQELGATITFCYQVMGEHISATYKAYFKSPTEAYEAAINYTLKNLI